MNAEFSIHGEFKVIVENNGNVIHETPWKSNLWLDQGMNALAVTPLANCFAVAAKGTGSTVTKEDLSGTYNYAPDSNTLTTSSGGRAWTTDDVGKIVRLVRTAGANIVYSRITAYVSGTVVSITDSADTPFPSAGLGGSITSSGSTLMKLYSAQQIALVAETERTITYGGSSGDNGTTHGIADDLNPASGATITNGLRTKTLKRTYLFDNEDTLTTYVPATNQYSQSGTTVTRAAGTRNFTSGDVGSVITFLASGVTATIVTYTNATTVTVTESQTVAAQAIKIAYPSTLSLKETTASTFTLSNGTPGNAGTLIQRASGSRDFTSGDIGKILRFGTANFEVKVSSINSTTEAVSDTTGDVGTAQAVEFYGFRDYQEFGFSGSLESGGNLNARVILDSPVRAYISSPSRPSDVIKIVYQVTATCKNTTSAENGTKVTDSTFSMSGSGAKAGQSAIETFATSEVAADGTSDLSLTDLEPYNPSYMAWSTDASALAVQNSASPVTGTRSADAAYVQLVADNYTTQTFTRQYRGTFTLNDAIRIGWRALMIYNPTLRNSIFTYLFSQSQTKDGQHTHTGVWKKTWKRILS